MTWKIGRFSLKCLQFPFLQCTGIAWCVRVGFATGAEKKGTGRSRAPPGLQDKKTPLSAEELKEFGQLQGRADAAD